MTAEEMKTVGALQTQGFGYKKISSVTGLPLNTVKAFCRRHKVELEPVESPPHTCRYCGKSLPVIPKQKPRLYCDSRCRMLFWGSHKDDIRHRVFYSFVCPQCGKPFTSNGNPHRKYCSKACAAAARTKGSDADER